MAPPAPPRPAAPLPPPRSVMQDCAASQGLDQLAELLAAGKLRVHLDR